MPRRIRFYLLAVVLLVSPAAHAADDALLACWRTDQPPFGWIRFKADGTCAWKNEDGGQTTIARTKRSPGTVVLLVQGQRISATYVVEGEHLKLTMGDKTSSYTRCEEPAGLDPKALALGKPEPIAAKRVDELKAEFAKRQQEDQVVRTDAAQAKRMGEVDHENTAWLTKLVQELGWIDCQRFGAEAANTAFLIVQHSGDVPLMMAALPEIEQDVKAKRLDAQPYALLYDRLELNLGRKQRYGSQIGQNEKGEMVVLPLEDRAHVEDLRRELGLFPLSTYLGFFKQRNGGKDIGFAEE